MKKVPFLNEKGEVVGTAISIGYRINNPEDYMITSDAAKPLKDDGERRYFVAQEVKR